MRNDFPQITEEKGCEFRIPDSRFQMADSKFTFHRLLPLLLWVKTIATWKTVIEVCSL